MNNNHIKDNIKFLRNYTGLSQGDFGALFKVSRDNIASYERGTMPGFGFIFGVVNYFHISYDDFIAAPLTEEKLQTKTTENLTLSEGKNLGKELGKKPKLQKTLPNKDEYVYDPPVSMASDQTAVYMRDPRDVELLAAKDALLQRDAELITSLQRQVRALESILDSGGGDSSRAKPGTSHPGTPYR